jgi:glucose-6-phosphate 1-dehydrogenase
MVTAVKDNLVEEIRTHGPKPAGPCAMVIFGITGDLSKRLLLPALYNLATHGLLNEHFSLAGLPFRTSAREQLREKLSSGLKEVCGSDCNLETMHRLISGLRYFLQISRPRPDGRSCIRCLTR